MMTVMLYFIILEDMSVAALSIDLVQFHWETLLLRNNKGSNKLGEILVHH